MSRGRGQRIAIWAIAIVLTIGTLTSFLVIVLANNNAQIDQARQQEQNAAYQKAIEEYQAKVEAQASELSGMYYEKFVQYASVVQPFEASAVTELSTVDLEIGEGEEIVEGSVYSAYYIGWRPDGKIFDQSIDVDNNKLKQPLTGGSFIEGWDQGVIGMRVGGVREITIPAAMAYGSTGAGEDIPPDTPIKFIVMIIPKVEEVPFPNLNF